MYSNNIDTNMYVFFLSPGIFTTKWVWRQFFYSRCGIKQFMNDFCPQKTFMSSIWMSSCFFSIRNHIFQRRIIEREKNLFSRNKSRAHATFFYHFFLKQTDRWLIHVSFANFVCLGNPIIHYLNLLINFFLNFDSDNVIQGRNVCIFDFNWIIQNECNMKFGLHASIIFQLWICFNHKLSINQ